MRPYFEFLACSLLLCASCVNGAPGPWTSLNPGGGGQIQGIVPDPLKQGRFYEISDMEGINESGDYGKTWSFVRGHITGEMYSAAFSPTGTVGGKRSILATGIYAAQISYDDGSTWSVIPGTLNQTVGVCAWSPSGSAGLVAPGWRIKDAGYVHDKIDPVRLHFNGTRNAWVSDDSGKTWQSTVYEQQAGYNQVYTVDALPVDSNRVMRVSQGGSQFVLGAHSGVYIGTSQQWTRLPTPPGAIDGTPDQTSRIGGCRGAAVTPDGKWVYATWMTGDVESLSKCANTSVSTVFVAQIPATLRRALALGDISAASALAASVDWTDVGSTSLPAIATCTAWGFPAADPTAPTDTHRILLGWGATGVGRNGLLLGTFSSAAVASANSSSASSSSAVTPIGSFVDIANDFTSGFNMTMGWEYRTWRPFSYNWKPKTWTAADPGAASSLHIVPEIYASGDMNLLRSNWSDSHFPLGPDAWNGDMYNHAAGTVWPPAQSNSNAEPTDKEIDYRPVWPGESTTFVGNGFSSTYNYDGAMHDSYAIQCMADHGILESWDSGLSWTQFSAPSIVVWPDSCSKSMVAMLTPPVQVTARNGTTVTVPAVLAHAGVGYGASGNKGSLLAKPLIEQSIHDKWEAIAAGGTIFDKECKVGKLAGLPNSNLMSLAIDPHSPGTLFVGTEMCGLFVTADWPALMNATLPGTQHAPNATFVSLLSQTPQLAKAQLSDIAVDPTQSGLIYIHNAAGHDSMPGSGLWKGQSNGSGAPNSDWTFTKLINSTMGRMGSIAAWCASSASQSASSDTTNTSGLLFASNEGTLLSLNHGESFHTVLDAEEVLELRGGSSALPWYNASANTVTFTSAAADGDVMIVAATDPNFGKGFGVFRGVLCNMAGKTVWQDWTGQAIDSQSGFGPDGFYHAPMYASQAGRARINSNTPDGSRTYTIATQLIGMWSRSLEPGLESLRAMC